MVDHSIELVETVSGTHQPIRKLGNSCYKFISPRILLHSKKLYKMAFITEP